MKAIGYLLAGVTLLPGIAAQLLPAADSSLPTGWKYKGCYADKWWNAASNETGTGAFPGGVSAYPRTLNGYFTRTNPNSASKCIATCAGLNKGYNYAGTNDNQCFCDTVIASNGTSTTAPAYGLADADNTNCFKGCRVTCPSGTSGSCYSTTEACGGPGASTGTTNGTSNLNIQRLSLYELTPVSGFLNNACVLKLGLLFFVLISGSARHDHDDTRTNSNERYEGIGRAGAYIESWVSQEAGAPADLDSCRSLAGIKIETDALRYNMTGSSLVGQISASMLKQIRWIEKISNQYELRVKLLIQNATPRVVVTDLYCLAIPLVILVPHNFVSRRDLASTPCRAA